MTPEPSEARYCSGFDFLIERQAKKNNSNQREKNPKMLSIRGND